ncbi:hypothetical protein KM043_005468 [Ampulex compressa]|nr:hypothetical protein KM043_005468 [Ampulex compressa]
MALNEKARGTKKFRRNVAWISYKYRIQVAQRERQDRDGPVREGCTDDDRRKIRERRSGSAESGRFSTPVRCSVFRQNFRPADESRKWRVECRDEKETKTSDVRRDERRWTAVIRRVLMTDLGPAD